MGAYKSKYTGQQIEAMLERTSANPPYIGENKNWYVYDNEIGGYTDSGISAQGPEGPQGSAGPTGETGNQGAQGPTGEDGKSFTILGIYPTLSGLETSHPTGNVGDAYAVGTEASNVIYIWDVDLVQWVNVGALQGPQGPSGEAGQDGLDGKSAYQSAVDGGYAGTEAEFNTILATAQSQISALNLSLSAEVTNLTNVVSSEATTRANADTTLQTNITNEATARSNADALKANIASPNLTGKPTIASNIIYHAGNITVSTVVPSSALAEGYQHQVY